LALDLLFKDLSDSISSGELVDSSNNDLSMNSLHSVMGGMNVVDQVKKTESMLNRYGLVEDE